MGLAPYGEPRYVDLIKDKLIEIKEDGSIRMNHEYFGYSQGLRMTNRAFNQLLGGPPRRPESKIGQREMDLARSIQVITEEVLLNMARYVQRQTAMENLCLAGGVALNCVANGRVLREVPFQNVWIQPAAGDAGGALGIALAIWHRYLDQPRVSAENAGRWRSSKNYTNNGLPPYADGMKGSYLGPKDSPASIERFLNTNNLPYKRYDPDQLADVIAEMMAQGKVIGLHQGRMEFGPRALGGRSIIGDARSAKMQSLMNLKIKYRESFRPFAPSVLREDVAEWFDLDTDSPYMLLVANVTSNKRKKMSEQENSLWGIEKLNVPRSEIPAVTHVDYSARVQTVRRETNPLYWKIIAAFKNLTDCPVIVNTSFNVRGEPIVCTPADSYRCFMRTEMDVLVLENFVLLKAEQPKFEERADWRSEFALD
jgi:carbamoyltransferase